MISTDRFFDTVFVRPPGDSYNKCVSTNPAKNEIDVALAKRQHRNYVSIMKEVGLEVIELPPLVGFPDSVFMQDPALLGSRTSVLCHFGEETRIGEEKLLLSELSPHRAKIPEVKFVREPGTLEGGDVLITDHGLFVGESKRTNSDGIRQLATYLNGITVTPVRTDLLHLLCGCTYMSDRRLLIVPELVSQNSFPGYEFVFIPQDEAYAADALYVGEGRVLIPSGFPKTSAKLKAAGYKPIEVDVSEFYKGNGGVTCLCSPVYKLF